MGATRLGSDKAVQAAGSGLEQLGHLVDARWSALRELLAQLVWWLAFELAPQLFGDLVIRQAAEDRADRSGSQRPGTRAAIRRDGR
ncbi:hypothetical protein [Saccharopolyspora elongata]|uniref:Uncharacterized protein n=1 Tax=Saccharopolyspora elongata TaxID=2530387 RepID=A0A4V2YNR1_9PSEU|nr:hypothetical protein [Saccharopolyspora elongata]TDD55217.1 hypothetical protein E1288_05285 [Saccharopolyspora elongata]